MPFDRLWKLLDSRCDFEILSVRKIRGGWSAGAFVLETPVRRLLLKEYRKNRAAFQKLIAPVAFYMPALEQLNKDPVLTGRISRPVKFSDGQFLSETNEAAYLLFDFVAGRRAAQRDFNVQRVIDLADIIARLHDIPAGDLFIKKRAKAPEEDFKTDFCSSLLDLVYGQTVCDLRSFIAPYRRQIRQKVALLEQLAKQLRSGDREKVLCHTDIHTGNLITLKDGFVLIDWEGLKFAPPEADLFCIFSYPWKDIFFERYLKRRQNIRIDQAGILFYQTRRVLEDIFEFAEQLQFETMTPAKRSKTFCFLKELCEAL